jgi:hypothetical protein
MRAAAARAKGRLFATPSRIAARGAVKPARAAPATHKSLRAVSQQSAEDALKHNAAKDRYRSAGIRYVALLVPFALSVGL